MSRYSVDDLRRLAVDLLTAAGLSRSRAATWARQLVGLDELGWASDGIATLPETLEALSERRLDPKAEPVIVRERSSTACISSGPSVPGLVMMTAAELAEEKARETGTSILRIQGWKGGPSFATVAVDLAISPYLVSVVGPGPSLLQAWPVPGQLPWIYDRPVSSDGDSEPTALHDAFALADNEVVILAQSTLAIETAGRSRWEPPEGRVNLGPGWHSPELLVRRRAQAEAQGLSISGAIEHQLQEWAQRLIVPQIRPRD